MDTQLDKGLTADQILHLRDTISRGGFANQYDPIWREAFKLYNAAPKNRPLSLSCSACYQKVYYYFLNL